MADCPGVVHLAAMADGGLARLRIPSGRLDARLLRAVADAAERLGSGVVDLTNRANLQIRGLRPDGGPALAAELEASGFRFHGEADRRRNILLDPFSGLDIHEIRDLRPLAEALDEALIAAPWIADLSPKFSFGLDGGGGSGIAAIASDVTALATLAGVALFVGGRPAALAQDEAEAVGLMLGWARTASEIGPDARASDLWHDDSPDIALDGSSSLPLAGRGEVLRLPVALVPRFGAFPTRKRGVAALSLAVPVGRLDPAMLRFLADIAEVGEDGHVRLAPWSGVAVPGVAESRAAALLKTAESLGFLPVAVAERLSVVACAGAPACERAREPAKALAAAVLALGAAEPARLPQTRATLHLSACPKGCAGSAPADLLLLGSSERDGWSVRRGGSPRRPGPESGRLDRPDPAAILTLLASRA